jgi:hypothetical protein
MTFFDYPVTNPIPLRRWTAITLIVVGVAWVVLVTLISVAAVGYEVVPRTSTSFNISKPLWYETFLHGMPSVIPSTWTCAPSILKKNEGVYLFLNLG